MANTYKFLLFTVFALLLSIAVSEESIEVTVDNTPQPSQQEREMLEEIQGLKSELIRVNKIGEEKRKQFEDEMAKKMQDVKTMQGQLSEKEKAFVQLQDVVDSQKSKISELESKLEEYKAHAVLLQGPLNFLDFVVDLYESYIVPAYEVTVATVKPYYTQSKEFIQHQYTSFVTFYNTNETMLSVRATVYKYYIFTMQKISECWQIIRDFIEPYTSPYYPTISHYYQTTKTFIVEKTTQSWKAVCEGMKTVFTQCVVYYEIVYTEFKKVCVEYAPLVGYVIIFSCLFCLFTIARLLLSCLCPCKKCPLKQKCCCSCPKC